MSECKAERKVERKLHPITVLTELSKSLVEIVVEYYHEEHAERFPNEEERLAENASLTVLLHINHPGVLKQLSRVYLAHVSNKEFPFYDPPIPESPDKQYIFYRNMFRDRGTGGAYVKTGCTTPNVPLEYFDLLEHPTRCFNCGDDILYHISTTILLSESNDGYALCQSCQPKIDRFVGGGFEIKTCADCGQHRVAHDIPKISYCFDQFCNQCRENGYSATISYRCYGCETSEWENYQDNV